MNEQELFERWYLNESILNVVNKTPSGLAASPDDIYVDSYTRRAWAAWRASARYVGNTAGDIKTIIHLLRDSVRDPKDDKLMQDAATMLSRIPRAIDELLDMIDGGEECRGIDSQISSIIRILEGEEYRVGIESGTAGD